MGKKIPPKVSFFRACYICLLAAFKPSLLEKIESEDNEVLNSAPPDNEPRLRTVHRALWNSAGLIILFGMIGVSAGLLFRFLIGDPPHATVTVLQIFGALLLLWGTLFVRGFEIQSYVCVTLSERVNQWLYRSLYCVGTAAIVFSIVWERVK